MRWAQVLGIAVLLLLMALFDWPKMSRNMKREKIAYASLAGMGAVLAVLLVYDPELPGPTQWLQVLYQPLVQIMEKLIVKGG